MSVTTVYDTSFQSFPACANLLSLLWCSPHQVRLTVGPGTQIIALISQQQKLQHEEARVQHTINPSSCHVT